MDFSQLKHNFFLAAFSQLNFHGVELSSLICKWYHQTDICREIYGNIFSCTIYLYEFSSHTSTNKKKTNSMV
jgi:hypothetical protein